MPFGIVALEQTAMRRRAGIVDEDVDVAELRDDGVDELRHFMRVTQIARKSEGEPARRCDLRCDGIEIGAAARDKCQRRAMRGQHRRDRFADAGGWRR